MIRKLVIFTAACASLAPSARPQFLHLGQADPSSEGWHKQLDGTQPNDSPGFDTLNYWQIDGSSLTTNQLFYSIDSADAGFDSILNSSDGWKIYSTARVLSVTGPGAGQVNMPTWTVVDNLDYQNDWSFSLIFNTDEPALSRLTFLGASGPVTLSTLDIRDYHDYGFDFSPGANISPSDDTVSVFVDGVSVGSPIDRSTIYHNSSTPIMIWGDGNGNPGGSLSRWNTVAFVVPEPSTAFFGVVALGGTLLRRTRRSRNA